MRCPTIPLRLALYGAFWLAGPLFAPIPVVHAQETPRPVIWRAAPIYPVVAKRMRVKGTVRVIASIRPNGLVSEAHATSGHPMLTAAAEDCVLHWRFAKAPTESTAIINVLFFLDDEPQPPQTGLAKETK